MSPGNAAAVAFAGTERFRVRRMLGEGSVGVVYEALDTLRDEVVALKTLRELAPETLLLLKNEFRAVHDLVHPNLVKLGELIEDRGRWFFTMEYVDGVRFTTYVRPRDPTAKQTLPPPDASRGASAKPLFDEYRLRDALLQLARGLQSLHTAQKVHRDIKPSNVLVTAEGRVVILDFGIVSDVSPDSEPSPDALAGTAHYMAPEQAAGEAVGPAADWYAVGCMLYQALTGRLPFEGSWTQVLEQKLVREPPPPRSVVREIPADLDELCTSLLLMSPLDRPTDADVLRLLGDEGPTGSRERLPFLDLFVGRTDEMSALDAALADNRRGKAVTIYVHGESGVGKTFLVRRFLDRLKLSDPGVLCFRGRCFERESVPFKAVDGIVDTLATYLLDHPTAELDGFVLEDSGVLGTAFPVLGQVPWIADAMTKVPLFASPQEQRVRVFVALRHLLLALCRRRPVVVFIEDMQWADADSVALLDELMAPPGAPPLLLVLTTRLGTETTRKGTASSELAKAQLRGDVRHLHVDELPEADSRALAVQLLGGGRTPQNDADALTIAQEARGHPMFIHELIHQRRTSRSGKAALRLDDALRARMERLDRDERRLLELVCVAGAPITHDVAAHAAAADVPYVFQISSRLKAKNLVLASGMQSKDTLEAYHDRIRQALLASLDETARKDWHSRLALALEAAPVVDAEALAVHWQGAKNLPRAAGYAETAAKQALAALAFSHAARLYRMALELEPESEEDAERLWTGLGEALANMGRGAEAADAFRKAAARSKAPLALRQKAADQLMRVGHIDDGLIETGDVLGRVGMRLPRSMFTILLLIVWRRAVLFFRGLGFKERSAESIRPEDLVRIDVCVATALTLANVLPIHALEMQLRSLLLALRAGEPRRVVASLRFEAAFRSLGGVRSIDETNRVIEIQEKLAERSGDRAHVGMMKGSRGIAAYLSGRWKAAYENTVQGVEVLASCPGATWELALVRNYVVWSLAYLGRYGEMERLVKERYRQGLQQGDFFTATCMAAGGNANLAWLVTDEPEVAVREADSAIALWSRDSFHIQHFWHLYACAHVDLYRDRPEDALRRVSASWKDLRRSLNFDVQHIRQEAHHIRARASIAVAAQKPAGERAALLRAAARDAKRVLREGAPYSRPIHDSIAAAVAFLSGDEAQARTLLESAARSFEQADMGGYAAAATRMLGVITKGEEGAAAIARADAMLRAQGVVRPERFVRVLVPGFGTVGEAEGRETG